MKIKGYCDQDAQFLFSQYAGRVVAFRPDFVKIAEDNLNAGLLLSQLLYWFTPTRSEDGKMSMRMDTFANGKWWLYKRYDQWYGEICLTADKAKKAMGILAGLGLVERDSHLIAGKRTAHIHLNVGELRRRLDNLYAGDSIDETDATVPIGTTGSADGHERSCSCALPTIAYSTCTEYSTENAEDSSLHSQSHIPSAINVQEEERDQDLDSTNSTYKKNGEKTAHVQNSRRPKKPAGRPGKPAARARPGVPDTQEFRLLKSLHLVLLRMLPDYELLHKSDPELPPMNKEEVDNARYWIERKDGLGFDLREQEEQEMLVQWWREVCKPGMSAEYRKRPTSINWLLHPRNLAEYSQAREALRKKKMTVEEEIAEYNARKKALAAAPG